MALFKNIILKLVVLLLLLIAMNFIYARFFFEDDLQKHSEIINLVREVPEDTDILYVGESSNVTFRYNDADKRSISAFIGDFYPDLQVNDITKPAAHAGIYKELLRNIPKDSEIKTLVVTLNLRSFNAQWMYSDLETSLQKSIVLLRPYPPLVNRMLLSFKDYDIKTKDERAAQIKRKWKRDKFLFPYQFSFKNVVEWDRWLDQNGILNEDGSRNQAQTELACHYVKAYAFQINLKKHPVIKDFDDIIKLAKERNWNLVFNLMAENTEKANDLIGKDLLFLMEQNRKKLISYFEEQGVSVVDNLYDVPDEEFIDQNWTTEHYAERGRKIVASQVAEAVSKFHPDNYVGIPDYTEKAAEVLPIRNGGVEFTNTGESKKYWMGDQTYSKEKVFIGDFASKTGGDNLYSMSFTYPIHKMPDSLKNKVTIDFQVFQTGLNEHAALVIQTEGSEEKKSWKGVLLSKQLDSIKTWEPFQFSYKIPDLYKDADILKIYVYNPQGPIIYIDDFKLRFE